MMEELYKVMDDLLDVEFQMKSGIDLLKELEEFYMLEKETEESDTTESYAEPLKKVTIHLEEHAYRS